MSDEQISWTRAHEVTAGEDYGDSLDFYRDIKFLDYIFEQVPQGIDSLCDAGSGSGIVGIHIKKRLKSLGRIIDLTCVDVNPAQLEGIEAELEKTGLTGEYMESHEVSFLDWITTKRFDCVVSRLLNHYFVKEQQQAVVNKAYELLNDGGVYVNAVPLIADGKIQSSIHGMFEILEGFIAGDNAIKRYFITIGEVPTVLQKAGFSSFEIFDNYADFRIRHTFADFQDKFALMDEEKAQLEDYYLSQSEHFKAEFQIEEKDGSVEASQPMCVVRAVK